MEEKYIGNYKILKKIGAGGMARVYLAVHKDVPNLKVVLKVLTDARLADRFRQEADKLALLDGHPNICRIKHFFNHGEDFVIAMDFIEGETLDQRIEDGKKLDIREALHIISELLDTLETAHRKDISHRDIKPSNIMIDNAGNIKVIDFGIAKSKTDPNLTIAGTSCGTPAYMSPEQFNPPEDLDYRLVDIYAAGTTLYRLTTGELPFKGDNEFAIRDSKLFEEPPRPRKLNPEISSRLEKIIMKSISKEPSQRYQSASEMREALLPLMDGPKKLADEKTEDLISTEPKKHKKSKSKLPKLIGVLFIAVVVIAAVIYFIPDGSDEEAFAPDTDEPIVTDEPIDEIPPQGTLSLSIEPSGKLYLGEELIGSDISSQSITGDTGQYIVRIENNRATNSPIVDTVEIFADQNINRSYAFNFPPVNNDVAEDNEPAPPPVKGKGTVLVGSRPRGADIFIDGKLQSEKTPYTFTLVEGQHIFKLALDLEGRRFEFIDTVRVEKNGEHRVFYKSEI